MRLKLPVPVGCVDLGLDEKVENYVVFTYKLEISGFDPFEIQIIFPGN
jgi:hypothetical protein